MEADSGAPSGTSQPAAAQSGPSSTAADTGNPGAGETDVTGVAGGNGTGVVAGDGSADAVGDSLFDMSGYIGISDQACKECRRRKAKCNKALPICHVCSKYRRHCLYEKNARTPLTRKHLTEVEARLERAEAIIKQMRALVPPHLRTWERPGPSGGAGTGATASQTTTNPSSFNFSSTPTTNTTHEATRGNNASSSATTSTEVRQGLPEDTAGARDAESQRMLEKPPVDDFEWCEMEEAYAHGLSPDFNVDGIDEESPISDGMASLSVNEREGGYLGVASGAALLRILEPKPSRRASVRPHQQGIPSVYAAITPQPNPNRHVAETMIDAFFRLYHVSYPIIHEPTFRAQYSEVIPRPNGPCWTVLAYIVAAIGVWTSSGSSTETLDLALFSQARSILTFNFLEVGNLTLVQALTLSSNYQQKRDKPNSGYNYLGLAVRMAMGLGLHKEFQGWNITPLTMEIRRRVWWALCVFDVGATITFSRPDVWPYKGVEVSFPLNVNDKDLTAASKTYPSESNQITPYTAVATQARFHIAAHECYERVISKPFPSAEELLSMDANLIQPWKDAVPSFFSEQAEVPSRYALAQAVMSWRYRNLRIIMYRPFVIRRALRRKAESDSATEEAYKRCLADAKSTIETISEYWSRHEHNRLAAWYGLYFLFQAALIPCICLRNDPTSSAASDWRDQISTTLRVIRAMAPVNNSSARSYYVISDLCGRYLDAQQIEALEQRTPEPSVEETIHSASMHAQQQQQQMQQGQQPDFHQQQHQHQHHPQNPQQQQDVNPNEAYQPWFHQQQQQPVGESPQTQINSVFSMMWPNVPPMEAADVVMGDEAGWMEFLRAGSMEGWPPMDS